MARRISSQLNRVQRNCDIYSTYTNILLWSWFSPLPLLGTKSLQVPLPSHNLWKLGALLSCAFLRLSCSSFNLHSLIYIRNPSHNKHHQLHFYIVLMQLTVIIHLLICILHLKFPEYKLNVDLATGFTFSALSLSMVVLNSRDWQGNL